MVLKRRFFCCLLILMLLGAGAKAGALDLDEIGPCAAEGVCAGEVPVEAYIRLHVLAEDDGAAAQALKLEVRDACLYAARALLTDCADADAAWEALNENLALVALAARLRARVCGYAGEVRAETGVFDFPERRYGTMVVPAGEYRALRVVIGAGEGHNWWCVLYPTLCLPEDCAPGEPVRFHSTILNWLRGLLGGGA